MVLASDDSDVAGRPKVVVRKAHRSGSAHHKDHHRSGEKRGKS